MRADAAFKTARADVAAFDLQIAQGAEEAAALFADLRCAALRMIEATRFGFALKQFGVRPGNDNVDSGKDGDAHGLAAAAATDAFFAIPKFSWNRHGAGCAGNGFHRHYLA